MSSGCSYRPIRKDTKVSPHLVLGLGLEILYCKTATAAFLDFVFLDGVRINSLLEFNK